MDMGQGGTRLWSVWQGLKKKRTHHVQRGQQSVEDVLDQQQAGARRVALAAAGRFAAEQRVVRLGVVG